MVELRVFTFSPDWGLPTTGPFAVKLLAWLALANIAYRQVFENNPGRGPAGKSPWAEIDGRPVADSNRIIDMLGQRHGVDIDAELSDAQRAEARAWTRAFEEGYHQILEWELFGLPEGFAYIEGQIAAAAPPVIAGLVARRIRRHFTRQLHARGIARFAPDEIVRIGAADIDALDRRLSDRSFLLGDRPGMADLAVFGQVAPMVCWPMATPVADYAKARPAVVDFVERLRALCFADAGTAGARPGDAGAA